MSTNNNDVGNNKTVAVIVQQGGPKLSSNSSATHIAAHSSASTAASNAANKFLPKANLLSHNKKLMVIYSLLAFDVFFILAEMYFCHKLFIRPTPTSFQTLGKAVLERCHHQLSQKHRQSQLRLNKHIFIVGSCPLQRFIVDIVYFK